MVDALRKRTGRLAPGRRRGAGRPAWNYLHISDAEVWYLPGRGKAACNLEDKLVCA